MQARISIKKIFFDLIFSPECLFCRLPLLSQEMHFCSSCLSQFSLLEKNGRCSLCFGELYEEQPLCETCFLKPPSFSNISAFSYEGHAKHLVKMIKYGKKSELIEGAGGFMALQALKLDFPLPDLLVPIPLFVAEKWQRGFNQAELLARSIGKIFQRPTLLAIGKKFFPFQGRQAQKEKQERQKLPLDIFYLKVPSYEIEGKNILVIDDVYTTGTTLDRACRTLQTAYPKSIASLTLCR